MQHLRKQRFDAGLVTTPKITFPTETNATFHHLPSLSSRQRDISLRLQSHRSAWQSTIEEQNSVDGRM
jgi:hypothetical protein